jgi:hypothetical protein
LAQHQKNQRKEELELALTNPPNGIDRMDDCLAMHHKIFDAQRISFFSAQCLGRGPEKRLILREEVFGARKTLKRLDQMNPSVGVDRIG